MINNDYNDDYIYYDDNMNIYIMINDDFILRFILLKHCCSDYQIEHLYQPCQPWHILHAQYQQ